MSYRIDGLVCLVECYIAQQTNSTAKYKLIYSNNQPKF